MTTGTTRLQGVRVPSDMLEEIEEWRTERADQPSRAEAMRMLIRIGLDESNLRR